jgi:hypothetical protein
MVKEKIDKIDIYLLAAIAVLSLLLISVELIPVPTATVVSTQTPTHAPYYRSGVTAFVRVAPAPATMMATVSIA